MESTPSRALRYLPFTALVVDLAITTASALLAIGGRVRLDVFTGSPDTRSLLLAAPIIVLAWLILVFAFGGYRLDAFGVGTDEYKRVINASLATAGAVSVACFLAKVSLPRGFFLLVFVVGVPALTVGRFVLRRALHRAREQGLLGYRVLIAGAPSHVDEIAAVLRRAPWLGYRVEGALLPSTHDGRVTGSGIPVVGTCDRVTDVVRDSGIDVIFFAEGALASAADLRRIAWDLEHEDVQVVVAPSVTDVSGERVRVRPVGGLPLMHIDRPRSTDASHWGKRLFDIVGSAALLAVLSPVFLVVALRIKVHDGGPVFFRQTRTGRNGEPFECLKFRTMVVDAENRLSTLLDVSGSTEGLFKLKDDPRVTRPGRWLRRYSIDELPQLTNVLRGKMSLVGPRPPLPREVATYQKDMHRRLRVRPGMTGLWQVSGRSNLSWTEAIRLDLYYVDNWSMIQDLNILGKTVWAVLRSDGAY
ncbi:MAG TPA: sugar transferase [Nocardioides sp.]|nr:sugar transferase [Nocardioides sp.]